MNKTKRKIFEASMKLFAEKGYDATSIEEITANVGVAKGTLYYHFTSKEEIFYFLVEEGIKLMQNSIDIKTSKLNNYIDKLKAIVLIQIKVVVKYENLITILLSQFWGKEERNQKLEQKIKNIEELKQYLQETKINPTKEINEKLENINSVPLKDSVTLYDLLKRTEITLDKLNQVNLTNIDYSKEVKEQVEIQIKYEGYISKIEREASKMLKNETKQIPEDIDYSKVKNLASEARQKLASIRPTSIGQAMRISGVNPSDISILMIYLRKNYNE